MVTCGVLPPMSAGPTLTVAAPEPWRRPRALRLRVSTCCLPLLPAEPLLPAAPLLPPLLPAEPLLGFRPAALL